MGETNISYAQINTFNNTARKKKTQLQEQYMQEVTAFIIVMTLVLMMQCYVCFTFNSHHYKIREATSRRVEQTKTSVLGKRYDGGQ